MSKMKTHKASAKRFSLTATGKIKMNHCNRRHQVHLKTAKRKRQLRTSAYVSVARAYDLKRMIPYA